MNYKTVLILSLLCITNFLSHGMETKPTQEAIDEAGTRLWNAISRNNIEEVKQLITENVADLNAGESAPLIFASWAGRIECVQALIKAGANVNFIGKDGETALSRACINNQILVAKALIEAGADVNLHAFKWAITNKNTKLVEMLVNDKTNVDYALLLAINNYFSWKDEEETNNNLTIIKILIKAGNANVNIQDADQCTPLILAAKKDNNVPLVKALIEAGADVNMIDKNGNTALLVALENMINMDNELIKLFVKAGANINASDENGTSALAFALKNGVQIIEPKICMTLINPITQDTTNNRNKIQTLLMGYTDCGSFLSILPKEILKIILTYTYPEYAMDRELISYLHPDILVDNLPLETLSILIKNGTLNKDSILAALATKTRIYSS